MLLWTTVCFMGHSGLASCSIPPWQARSGSSFLAVRRAAQRYGETCMHRRRNLQPHSRNLDGIITGRGFAWRVDRLERLKVDRLERRKLTQEMHSARVAHIYIYIYINTEAYRHINGCIHMSLKHAGSHMGRCTQIYIPCDPLFGTGRRRIRNILQVTCRRYDNVSGTLASYYRDVTM